MECSASFSEKPYQILHTLLQYFGGGAARSKAHLVAMLQPLLAKLLFLAVSSVCTGIASQIVATVQEFPKGAYFRPHHGFSLATLAGISLRLGVLTFVLVSSAALLCITTLAYHKTNPSSVLMATAPCSLLFAQNVLCDARTTGFSGAVISCVDLEVDSRGKKVKPNAEKQRLAAFYNLADDKVTRPREGALLLKKRMS
eukprot:3693607-Amphidinium_carterae.2